MTSRLEWDRWLRLATLGLAVCAIERAAWWRDHAETLDRLAASLGAELGPLKALASDPLIQRALAAETRAHLHREAR